MKVLLIDTTRDVLLVALVTEKDAQTRTNDQPRRHSESLNTISKSFIPNADAFAVVTGPGSWTGSRVGVVAVKAWALVTGKPIIATTNPTEDLFTIVREKFASRDFTEVHELSPFYDSEFKLT